MKPHKMQRRQKAIIGKRKSLSRYRKGHSSDSNPNVTTFRDRVKGQQRVNTPSGDLSAILDEAAKYGGMDDDASDATGFSQISHFTNCTNPTFNKVHRIWRSGSTIQKDVITVLASVTDIIRESGGSETETEYFAALLSTLASNVDNISLLSATAYLLHLVAMKVPVGIAQKKFVSSCQTLLPVIGVLAVEDANLPSEPQQKSYIALRYLVATLGSLLAAQRRISWIEEPLVGSTFEELLKSLSNHNKPKVRKAVIRMATEIVCRDPIVLSDTNPSRPHPAADILARFCLRQIETNGGTGSSASVTLSALNLLAPVFHRLPSNLVKQLCETILRLLTLANAVVRLSAYNAIYCLFHFGPPPISVPQELCGQLILALHDFKPSENDPAVIKIWVQSIAAAHKCLNSRSRLLPLKALPRFVDTMYDLMKSSTSEVVDLTISQTTDVLESCLGDIVTGVRNDDVRRPALDSLLGTVGSVLKYANFSCWPKPFYVIGAAFRILGPECAHLPTYKAIISQLVSLRETESVEFNTELERVVGAAISNVGPETVLKLIGLGLDPQSPQVAVDFQRSWVVPLLRKFVKESTHSKLATFQAFVLPVAIRVNQKLKILESDDQTTEAKIYRSFELQLWDLLPSFCRRPTDLIHSLENLAKVIGNALVTRPDLRLILLSAVRNLIRAPDRNAAIAADDGPETGAAPTINPMTTYAKNFLPIIFQLYTQPPGAAEAGVQGYDIAAVKLASLETIRNYLPIAPQELRHVYMQRALEKVDEMPEVSDILIALTSYLTEDDVRIVFEKATLMLQDAKQAQRKKPLRILQEILQAGDSYKDFISKNSTEFEHILRQDATSVSPAAQAARMSMMIDFLPFVPDNDHFLKFAVHESVLGLKGKSSKLRKCSAKTLLAVVRMLKERENTELDQVLELVTLWLRDPEFDAANNAHKMCCVLVAFRLLAFEFAKELPSQVTALWIGELCKSLSSDDRSIVQHALECLTTMTGRLPQVTISQFLDILVPAIYTQQPEVLAHFRYDVRRLLVKLVKKFSAEAISSHVPAEHQPHLNYVRKMIGRRERKQTERRERKESDARSLAAESDIGSLATMTSWVTKPESIGELLHEDSGSELEEEETKKSAISGRSRRSKHAPVWLSEAIDEQVAADPLDLLDSKKAARSILVTDPTKSKGKKQKMMDGDIEGFKLDKKTGKLIIADSDEEADKQEEEPDGRKRKRKDSESSEVGKRKRKRKNSGGAEDSVGAKPGYRPGGRGIHRDTTKSQKSTAGKGDASRKDGMQPFAYVPLNRGALNKRKSSMLKKQYKVVKSGVKQMKV